MGTTTDWVGEKENELPPDKAHELENDYAKYKAVKASILEGDDEDLKWLIDEFESLSEMLGDAFNDAQEHCSMLGELVRAIQAQDPARTEAAVAAAIHYHIPPETELFGGAVVVGEDSDDSQ